MGSTRRRLLTGAVALAGATTALAGCSLLGDEETPPAPPPPPDALEPLLAETRALADRHRAALLAHPDLTARLTPLLEAHTAHIAELTKIMTPPPSPPMSAPPGPASSAPAAVPTSSPTVAAQTTVAELRAAEQTGQKSAAAACAGAPAGRAALLGSIAAARATHAEVLR